MASFDDWVTDPAVTRAGVGAFIADPALVGTPFLGRYVVCTTSGTTGHPGIFVHDPRSVAVSQSFVLRIDLAWLSPAGLLAMARHGLRWAGAAAAGTARGSPERLRPLGRDRLPECPRAARRGTDGRPAPPETGGGGAGRRVLRDGRPGPHRGGVHAYAASEFTPLAFDCGRGWLHVNSDWAILEPVGADYAPTPPGEYSHTVRLINLANRVQPIIRYDLGDSVLAKAGPCGCGSPLPAIRVAGRRDDVLRLPAADGTTVRVLPLAIGSVLNETPGLHRSQLLQTGPATLRLRLEPEPGADAEAVWQAASGKLGEYLAGLELGNVDVVRAEEPPEQSGSSGKFRQVIARVPE